MNSLTVFSDPHATPTDKAIAVALDALNVVGVGAVIKVAGAASKAGSAARAGVEALEASVGAARGAEGAFSRMLIRDSRALQKGFTKHGADFGLTGNWNPSRAADFSRTIHRHINSPNVKVISGTYRGNPVTHYIDPSTGGNVMADPTGRYVSGWQLGAEQLEGVLTTGRLF